ncbi:cytochrome c/c1 heme-lyase [Chytridium lagenaria]|nr:cytochrome c/c1 heme-lyase [Chytridium lagenaria]
MPAPNQQPAPGQRMPLSKERENWIYPSEQMFYNAMKRKNWSPHERDMGVVVPIHNAVNEQCWKKILEWENLHETTCATPKLLKFEGKPRTYTPKARIMNLLGYTLPFDRHDWTIDRCGTSVRYVIDFYAGAPDANGAPASMYLDVRPALSFDGITDRIRKFWKTGSGLF